MNNHKTRGIKDLFKLFLAIFFIFGGLIYILLYSSTFSNFSFRIGPLQISNQAFSIESFKNYSQAHPAIISHLKKYHLFPPSILPYSFDKYPHRIGKDRIAKFVIQLLKNQRNGFFIECGANDGEFLSNSITLEMEYGWTGLLVEADPEAIEKLKGRHRRAWVADVCLAVLPYPHKADMIRINGWSPMSHVRAETIPEFNITSRLVVDKPADIKFTAQCFPLYSILTALNVSAVDYLSLDVEGAELAILKTFPFDDKIIIKVISAEVKAKATDGFRTIINFLRPKGYRVMAYIVAEYTHDLIFAHKSVHTLKEPVPANIF